MSEPYSEELADMETARRLLEFGDDYRNYLDSQSDCSWGVGGNDSASSLRRRKPPVSGTSALPARVSPAVGFGFSHVGLLF